MMAAGILTPGIPVLTVTRPPEWGEHINTQEKTRNPTQADPMQVLMTTKGLAKLEKEEGGQ
jgi:hypothetical protein